MKAISLAFDVSSTKIPNLPPIFEYAGYILCPANIVLGPFVTFSSYKNCHRSSKLSLRLSTQIALNSLLSIVFIMMSSCLLGYLISDHLRFFVTYRDALIFRTSHYFVSFMSAATLLASGIECQVTSETLGYQVTKPFDIELPRSLIPVVISWNIPIHLWVKTCEAHRESRGNEHSIVSSLRRYLPQFKAIRHLHRHSSHLFDHIIASRSQFPTGCCSAIDRRIHLRRIAPSESFGGDLRCMRHRQQMPSRFCKFLPERPQKHSNLALG